MKKVYIPNKSGHNFDDAERFGALIFLSEGYINRFKVNEIYRIFAEAMSDSHSDDYIIISSMNVMNAVASAIFARKHGRLNLLQFYEGKYVPRELDIDALIGDQDEHEHEGEYGRTIEQS